MPLTALQNVYIERRCVWDRISYVLPSIDSSARTGGFMFDKALRYEGHVKRFLIQDGGQAGWEVREEQDEKVVRKIQYTDWHRVERAMLTFTAQIGQLEANGWRLERPQPVQSTNR
jgi:hypothetical protein